MRIALLAHARHPIAEPFCGGLEAHTAVTADTLVARGHAVTLFAKAGSRSRAEVVEIAPAGLTFGCGAVRGVDAAELQLDAAYRQVLDLADLGGYDAILDNTLSPVPYARSATLPTLTVLHTPADLPRTNAVLADPAWEPGPQHRFVAVSAVTWRDWARRLPRVACVPNGIDLSRWHPDTRPTRRTYAAWSGRITPEKGLHLAIDAARLAGWPLRISGPVSNLDYFRAEIAPRLGPRIRYAGHLTQPELRTFLAAAAVLVFSPCWAEPFGLAAAEAMACGTPVAALPAGAAAEVVDVQGGVIARDSTPEGLADALLAAVGLDRAAVHRSALRFDAERMVGAYEAALGSLVGPSQPRVADLVQT